jgi:hypothetical protein
VSGTGARGQRHARADRAALALLVAREQLADARLDDVEAADALLEGTVAVLVLLGAVDRDRDAEAVLRQEVDDLVGQQRGVGRQRVVHALLPRRGLGLGVLDGGADRREVQQRLAAEERDGHLRPVAAAAQQEVDRLPRRVVVHLRLACALAARAVGQPVLAVLVAVRARQVALVGDVEHQRRQRERHRRQLRARRRGFAHRADDAEVDQVVQRRRGGRAIGAIGEPRLVVATAGKGERVDDRGGVGVEAEDRRRGGDVDELQPAVAAEPSVQGRLQLHQRSSQSSAVQRV